MEQTYNHLPFLSPSPPQKSNFEIKFASLKDPIPVENCWDLYFIPCDCNLGYISQTKKYLSCSFNKSLRRVSTQEF